MYLALFAIAERLRRVPHFQSWDVRDGLSITPRQAVPAVDLRILGAQIAEGQAVITVKPAVSVALIAARGTNAPEQMDAAFTAAISALNGMQIKDASGRTWAWLRLSAVSDLPVADGHVGCELVFTTGAEFNGQQCDC